MNEQPITVEGICGNCFFWAPVEMKGPVTIGAETRGMCYGVPATPVPMYDNRGNQIGQKDMRSAPPASHRCCALFLPTAGMGPATDLKPTPPAPKLKSV